MGTRLQLSTHQGISNPKGRLRSVELFNHTWHLLLLVHAVCGGNLFKAVIQISDFMPLE